MSEPRTANLVCLVALAAVGVGCDIGDEPSGPASVPRVGPGHSPPPDADRTEGRIAFRVSGMKKTASGAT